MASRLQIAALAAVALAAGTARADEAPTLVESPDVAAVRVDEKLGAQVPLDLRFRDQDGVPVTLRDLLTGDQPVVLTFNYSSCPMLCSMQLNNLVRTLPSMTWAPGRQFRLVTIVIEPKEEPARAARTRALYLDGLGDRRGDAAAGGWTFLVSENGSDEAIRRLADAVGVGYRYNDNGEWAHPAVLVYLSPSGVVNQYVHGFEYDPKLLDTAVMKAGIAEPQATAGFLARCFHQSPDRGSGARAGAKIMRYTAAVFAAMVVVALFLVHYLRRTGRRS
jgi:protein SCO1/2